MPDAAEYTLVSHDRFCEVVIFLLRGILRGHTVCSCDDPLACYNGSSTGVTITVVETYLPWPSA